MIQLFRGARRFPAAGRLQKRAPTLSLVLLLGGCTGAAAPVPTSVPTALPTVTPTSEVTFQVAVTPVVVRVHRLPPTPRPTRFVPPSGAFITLQPDSGPPVDRAITVVGGHLPANSPVEIVWAPSGKIAPLSTTGFTDRHGGLRTTLSVPASATGDYRVLAQVSGAVSASAIYHVVSRAALEASILPGKGNGTLAVVGKKFIPRFRLTLIAYPVAGGRAPVVLGNVQANTRGAFSFSVSTGVLHPGQYVLRAWSASSLAAQMAQTFFEVVV